jgi:hypothetical protein
LRKVSTNNGEIYYNSDSSTTINETPTFSKIITYPPSSTDDTVRISLSWNGVPIGSKVSFLCGTPPPDGTYISLPKTKVSQSYDTEFIEAKIPMGWTSKIT